MKVTRLARVEPVAADEVVLVLINHELAISALGHGLTCAVREVDSSDGFRQGSAPQPIPATMASPMKMPRRRLARGRPSTGFAERRSKGDSTTAAAPGQPGTGKHPVVPMGGLRGSIAWTVQGGSSVACSGRTTLSVPQCGHLTMYPRIGRSTLFGLPTAEPQMGWASWDGLTVVLPHLRQVKVNCMDSAARANPGWMIRLSAADCPLTQVRDLVRAIDSMWRRRLRSSCRINRVWHPRPPRQE